MKPPVGRTASFGQFSFQISKIPKFARLRSARGIWYHIRVSARWAEVRLDGTNQISRAGCRACRDRILRPWDALRESVRSLTTKDASKRTLPVRAVSPPSHVSFKVFSHTSRSASEEVSCFPAPADIWTGAQAFRETGDIARLSCDKSDEPQRLRHRNGGNIGHADKMS